MPRAPKPHRPSHQPQMQQQRRQQQDQRRESPTKRGYDERWARHAHDLCYQRVFCELCLTAGVETSIVRGKRHQAGGKRTGIVDHVVPAQGGQSDPLFWEVSNHRCLCIECHNWKTIRFDGGHGKQKREAVRTVAGIEARWREVVSEYVTRHRRR